MICNEDNHALPSIEFVAGETQRLVFNGFFYADNNPFNFDGCTCTFSLSTLFGENIINEHSMDVNENRVSVTLSETDTRNLHGKYLYQITIKDNSDPSNVEIPRHGAMYIYKNIKSPAQANA